MTHILKLRMMLIGAAFGTAAVATGCASTPSTVTATKVVAANEERATPPPPPCPDGDGDGVCDSDDRCPGKSGPSAAFGCPIDPCGGTPLLVLVQFKYNSSEMPAQKEIGVQTMDPVLDAVAEAIALDQTCRVCIAGHASEEGTAEHNENLSRRRASAVQGYLTAHDLVEARIPTIGMGERCQLVPKTTRGLNRRVEFRRLGDGEACPNDCSG